MNVFCPSSLSNSKLPAAAAAKSLWSCSTLCDPRDGSPPGSAIPGILQARTLEWVAIAFSLAMSNLAISVCPAQSMTIQELGSQTHTFECGDTDIQLVTIHSREYSCFSSLETRVQNWRYTTSSLIKRTSLWKEDKKRCEERSRRG